MRIFVLLLTGLVFFHSSSANASSFSAVDYIRSCMADTLSPPAQQKCAGFFYGLISKKQALLSPTTQEGLVGRAISSRTPSKNYGAIAKRQTGVEEVCLPLDLSYQDFRQVIDRYQLNSQLDMLTVNDITKALAKKFSC